MNMPVNALQFAPVEYDPFADTPLARAVPTTEPQREIWLASQLGVEASLAFNESVSLRMSGPLDTDALQAALQALVDRHESLRCTVSGDGQSLYLAQSLAIEVAVDNLGALSEDAQTAALDRARADAVSVPFDLEHGPLFRARLLRLSLSEHVLLLTAHHIVCDGWSFGLIARELMALYGACAAGRSQSAELPPAESFGDYAVACRSNEQGAAAQADEQFWVDQFDASVPVLDLPADRPRASMRTFVSRREDLRLEPALVDAARKLGAPRGASMFATLFGLFAGLMGRLGGEPEVVVGVPAAGQPAAGVDTLVGHCVNLLPVRVSADPAQSVDSFLRHVRMRVLDAYEHQGCTFGRLLSKLHLDRDPARLPLVSVQFNLDAAIPSEALSVAGLSVSLSSNQRAFENFDLFVNASQTAGAVTLECQFNSDLFDAVTVRRWLALYRTAIERASADPQLPLAALYAATADDRAQIDTFNASVADFYRDARIEHLVGAQAARTPEATAVVDGDGQSLRYDELDRLANAVALLLVARGAGPGQRVGLACARSRHLVVGLLGILKTGAAYVPLDPAFPPDRLVYMIGDAGLDLVVSDTATAPGLVSGAAQVLLVDGVQGATAGPAAAQDPQAPAYVIYTSGSTGQPKGVVVPHRAVVNFLTSMAREPGLCAQDKLVAVTTQSFDIAVLELLLPLTVGGQVILADRDTVMDGPALRALVERHAANVMQATPSGWQLLIDAGWNGSPGFKALVGGEALPPDLAEQLLMRTGELWNMYGPTETTVWSTCWRVRPGADILIGTPIANTRVQVLDEHGHPCPIGVPGEIHIGGDGVADGYWQRPELTAERFPADPARVGKRMYRTGDRGRWRNDGLLEHRGRLDFQVKVRGYRIELGEIEANLLRHRAVDRALVVTREDEPGDVRIVAYVVPRDAPAETAVLRDFLRLSLPDYMVPAHVVSLQQVPLLPNGKIDRKALPRPDAAGTPSPGRTAPVNPLQEQVLRAMEQVLNLPGMGIGDDFFSLGGHSLLAAKLTARINRECEVSLPLRAVFAAPTAEGFAAAVQRARQGAAPQREAVVARPGVVEAPLTVMQERIRFMEQLQPGRVVYNTPSAHRLTGPFDRAAFESALRMMVERQPGLRTQIAESAAGPVQRVLAQVEFELPFEDLSKMPAAEREAELMRRLQAIVDQPMDIARAPLFRTALYRMASHEHVFLFMPHHIIWDGWSFDLLYREFAALLPAALEGRPSTLPALPVSYLDYAHWHARWMRGDECRSQIAYWKQRYTGVETPRAVPTDRARRSGMTGVGAVEWVHIGKPLTERLRQVAVAAGVTLNMAVMGIYAALLSQLTGSRSLVLGIPVRGRLASEVEAVMGFFNNLLPTHLLLQPELALADWLAVVKRELLDAFANQDVPFERLANEPELAAHAQKAGLYQSLFSFQDARARERHWGPLNHEAVLVMQKGATEDLGLWLMEVPSGLEGGINYNADLFSPATARLFRDRFVALLERAADAPGATLQALIEMPGDDTRRLGDWLEARTSASTGERDDAPPHVGSSDGPAPGAPRNLGSDATPNALEGPLAQIWARLLGIDASQIAGDDNFFDLGGSSLLVMRAIAEGESLLGARIDPARYVYENLRQLSLPGRAATVGAEVGMAPASAPAPKGLMSRVLGRFNRRA